MDKEKPYDPGKYWKPSLTTDVVLIAEHEHENYVLFIRRKNPPYQGSWAFPGGFLDQGETTRECAVRELEEETGVSIDKERLRLLLVADDPSRDPRTRVISVVFLACGKKSEFILKPGDDASEAAWFPLEKPPQLAFDHEWILKQAVNAKNIS